MTTDDPLTSRLSAPGAIAAVIAHEPEPIREHWCEVGGVRYPVKQVYHLITGLPRSQFTSHIALRALSRADYTTSVYRPGRLGDVSGRQEQNPATGPGLAFEVLSDYLADRGLTDRLAEAEADFAGADVGSASAIVRELLFTEDLLDAALDVRRNVGRLNDVIHATVIARTLPLILEDGEQITVRPSLGAGNDPSRPYDLETDRRIAEFKVAQWKGADTMRKRGAFKDLVHLALDRSDRRAELYVVGPLPGRFLSGSSATARWALERSGKSIRDRFDEAFGDRPDMTVAEFRAGPAAHVAVIDLATLLPSLR